MTKDHLYEYVFASAMFQRWHWLRYHFEHRLRGSSHPLAESIIAACLDCEVRIPGFAHHMVNAIASLSGREKYVPHWEQLLQCLAEILIVRQVLTSSWSAGAKFSWEPTAEGSKKNPEITVETAGITIGIEVKAPALFAYREQRSANPFQLASRSSLREELAQLFGVDRGITLPRDNPVKDFLISAESKFKPFRNTFEGFFGVLVIVWDDFIYEPVSALIHPQCGLLTDSSFARDENGVPLRFPSVDGVVVVRHLHQLVRACRDKPLMDQCRHALDYGRPGEFPFKVFIQNPNGRPMPDEILKCLQADPPTPMMGAEYLPTDLVGWLGS